MRPIMIIEDSPDDKELTLIELKKRNGIHNDIVWLQDGGQVLNYFWGAESLQHAILPEVILLDLSLPKVDGLELLEKFRADPHLKNIPIIVVTGSNVTDSEVRALKLGCPYIRKPISFVALQDAARALGLKWLLLNA